MSHFDLETAVIAEFFEDRLQQSVKRIEEGEADLFVAFTLIRDVYWVERASGMH